MNEVFVIHYEGEIYKPPRGCGKQAAYHSMKAAKGQVATLANDSGYYSAKLDASKLEIVRYVPEVSTCKQT